MTYITTNKIQKIEKSDFRWKDYNTDSEWIWKQQQDLNDLKKAVQWDQTTSDVNNSMYIMLKRLSDRLSVIENRLAILEEPDPEKLEKYKALKEAYENYKALEQLIADSDDE